MGEKPPDKAVLHTDGYTVYAKYAQRLGITHAQCWAHCRREFINAQDIEPERAEEALQAIAHWLTCRDQIQLSGQNALFVGRTGTRLGAPAVWQRLRRRSQLAQSPVPVHPHMLRHSFASHVLQSSGDLRAVQELLGHANISTTQVYTKLDFQHLAKAYDAAHPRAKARKPA